MVRTIRSAAAVVATLVAGCGGTAPAATTSATPTPPSTAEPTPTGVSVVSTDPTATPDAPPTAGAAGSPITFHADPTLEAMLPDEIDGEVVRVETVLVRDYLQLLDPASEPSAQLRRFLLETGADPELVSVAFATYGSGPDDRCSRRTGPPAAARTGCWPRRST